MSIGENGELVPPSITARETGTAADGNRPTETTTGRIPLKDVPECELWRKYKPALVNFVKRILQKGEAETQEEGLAAAVAERQDPLDGERRPHATVMCSLSTAFRGWIAPRTNKVSCNASETTWTSSMALGL